MGEQEDTYNWQSTSRRSPASLHVISDQGPDAQASVEPVLKDCQAPFQRPLCACQQARSLGFLHLLRSTLAYPYPTSWAQEESCWIPQAVCFVQHGHGSQSNDSRKQKSEARRGQTATDTACLPAKGSLRLRCPRQLIQQTNATRLSFSMVTIAVLDGNCQCMHMRIYFHKNPFLLLLYMLLENNVLHLESHRLPWGRGDMYNRRVCPLPPGGGVRLKATHKQSHTKRLSSSGTNCSKQQ